jgi:hypothetical protein
MLLSEKHQDATGILDFVHGLAIRANTKFRTPDMFPSSG